MTNEATSVEPNIEGEFLYLTPFVVQRIVYEVIRNYMIANPPKECGVSLAQTYDMDDAKSQIFLDIAYNWKTQAINKLPAIYVQREDVTITSPTIGQSIDLNARDSRDTRLIINEMPIIVSCIAAAPVAVVEYLAEYVKQPLLYYRKEVTMDFRLRRFRVLKVTKPELLAVGKSNFVVNIMLNTAFDEGWVIQKDSLKLKTGSLKIFDGIVASNCKNCNG